MKFSQLNLKELSTEQLWNIVCGDIADDGASSEYAILLGGRPPECGKRAKAAAELYLAGRVKYIIPSGGVEWDFEDGQRMTEALYMKRVLLDEGVPNNAIIVENNARTTKENLIFATLLMNRKDRCYQNKDVTIVTSACHMQRSLALAKTFLPRMLKIHSYPRFPEEGVAEWLKEETNLKALLTNARIFKDLIKQEIIDDIEVRGM